MCCQRGWQLFLLGTNKQLILSLSLSILYTGIKEIGVETGRTMNTSHGDYQEFKKGIKHLTGIDLSLYKEAQMKRRITSLYERQGFTSFNEYYAHLRKDECLLNELLDRMTINVSNFFRNDKRWEFLAKSVLPELLSRRKKLKIWSAACSTGEEPYSLAMVLSHLNALNRVFILATDIDETVLEVCKRGIYSEKSLEEVPGFLRHTYFKCVEGDYHIDQKIKDAVTFKKHNLLADSYGQSYDLIICRNVLIYFTDEAKGLIYKKFSSLIPPLLNLF